MAVVVSQNLPAWWFRGDRYHVERLRDDETGYQCAICSAPDPVIRVGRRLDFDDGLYSVPVCSEGCAIAFVNGAEPR